MKTYELEQELFKLIKRVQDLEFQVETLEYKEVNLNDRLNALKLEEDEE